MLNELSKTIRFDNASKGFDPTEGGVNRYILLTISEICEAQDEIRDGKDPHDIYYKIENTLGLELEANPEVIEIDEDGKVRGRKPCGFSVEIADAIIRILDICGKFDRDIDGPAIPGIDFEEAVIDNWLLGAVNIISDCFNYDTDQEDFWYSLIQGMGTLFVMCERLDIDIMPVIEEKLAFNKTRPPKHGRKF